MFALTLAELVGPEGWVVGVDLNPAILETARQRATDAGIQNVEFVAGDARTLAFTDKFDAIVGRFCVDVYGGSWESIRSAHNAFKNRAASPHSRSQNTRFIPRSLHPDTPLMNQLIKWILDVFEHSGAHLGHGHWALSRFLLTQVLPPPTMHLESPIGAAKTWAGYRYMATIFQSLLPLLEKYRLATVEQVDVDTLAARIRREVLTSKRPFFFTVACKLHIQRFQPKFP